MVDTLINLQRSNCRVDKLLSEKDLKRIINRTGGLINTNNECILWKGYITHNKIDYINFYFKGKKCALHRILYINFKGKLNDNDYLEFICEDKSNKGRCCNINHIVKKRDINNLRLKNNSTNSSQNNTTNNTPNNSPNHSPLNSPNHSPNINIVYFD
jgi:hypothetical protein